MLAHRSYSLRGTEKANTPYLVGINQSIPYFNIQKVISNASFSGSKSFPTMEAKRSLSHESHYAAIQSNQKSLVKYKKITWNIITYQN